MDDIVCRVCGTHAASGEAFCGGCGAFLEWDGERIAGAAAPGAGGAAAAATASGTVPDPQLASPATVSPPAAGAPESGPPAAAEAIDTTVAQKAQPIAVQPATPTERPRPAQVPRASRLVQDAVYCGSCGEANSPERRFCRRCGALLEAPAPVVATRLPWWRRIFRHRNASATPASATPGGSAAGVPASAAGVPDSAGGRAAPAPAGASPSAPSGAGKQATLPKVPGAPKAPAAPAIPTRGLQHAGSQPVFHQPNLSGGGRSLTPSSLPRRGSKVGKGLALVVVLAVIAFSAIPPLRHDVTSTYDRIFSKAHPIALAGAPTGRHHGACSAPVLGQDNATLYWYTRPASVAAQSVTVTVAPSFTGSVSSIVFTPLVANPSTTLAGPSPHPVTLDVSSEPAGTSTVIQLKNPPVLQGVTVSISRPTSITLRLVSSDPGAARGTCAETGIVFEGKNS